MNRRRTLSRSALARYSLALSVCLGCRGEAAPTGALMLGIRTNMAVTKDVDAVHVRVEQGGGTVYDKVFPLGDSYGLPATLAIVRGQDSSPVTVTVSGQKNEGERTWQTLVAVVPSGRVDTQAVTGPRFGRHVLSTTGSDAGSDAGADADGATGDASGLRLLSASIDWLCARPASVGARGDGGAGDEDAGDPGAADGPPFPCPEGQTCIAGQCVSSEQSTSELPWFNAEEFFGKADAGGGDSCFDVLSCFQEATVLTSIDTSTCRIDMAMDSNLNLAMVTPTAGDGFCDGQRCLIPLDRGGASGWTPGAAGLTLPQGLCDRLLAQSASSTAGGAAPFIMGVAVSEGCPSKLPSQRTCAYNDSPPVDAPVVTSSVPANAAVGVDPDAAIRVSFSQAIDQATLTPDTFRVSLAGQPAVGAVVFDNASNTALWTSNTSLSLLGEYTVALSSGITGSRGVGLAHGWSATFRVRDGAWQPVVSLGPKTQTAPLMLAGDDAGDAILIWDLQSRYFSNEQWQQNAASLSMFAGLQPSALGFRDEFGPLTAFGGPGLAEGADFGVLDFARFDGNAWSVIGSARDVPVAGYDSTVLALLPDRALALSYKTTGPLVAYSYSGGAFESLGTTIAEDAPARSDLVASALALGPTQDFAAYWSDKTNAVNAVVRDSQAQGGSSGDSAEAGVSDGAAPASQWGTSTSVAGYTSGVDGMHAFADVGGRLVVIWAAVGAGADSLNSIVESESDVGVMWSTPRAIATTTGTVANLHVARNPRGDLVAIWHEVSSDMSSQIRSQFRLAGQDWSDAQTVAEGQGDESLGLDPQGNALAFFLASDGSVTQARYSNATQKWASSAYPIDTGGTLPLLAVDGVGRAVAAWVSSTPARGAAQVEAAPFR